MILTKVNLDVNVLAAVTHPLFAIVTPVRGSPVLTPFILLLVSASETVLDFVFARLSKPLT